MLWRRKLPKLRGRIARLEPALEAQAARLQAAEARIAQLEATINGAQQSALISHSEALAGHAAWLQAQADGLQAQADGLQAQAAGLQANTDWLGAHTDWLRQLEQGIADLRQSTAAQLLDLNRWLSATTQVVTAMSSVPVIASPELQAIGPQARRIDDQVMVTRSLQIWTVMRWLAQSHFEADLLISVILPTRNRRPWLARAIASILAQTYPKFELIVIDDASTDDTADYLATLTDPRLCRCSGAGGNTSAARNIGLRAASGSIIVHFDDDNLMDPNWLRGVAWGFTRWPETELLYGARIIEDGAARDRLASGAMPVLDWQPFDRARLETSNYIDMNVLAHRAGLPGAHFEPSRKSSIEWELALRLTGRRAPLELPVIACLYSNYAPNRLSDRIDYVQENQRVRARVHTTRPMRVLSYNALFPLRSETYIEEEMLALEAAGASIAFASFGESVSPYPVRQPIFPTLEAAIAAHDPDVMVIYWTTHAIGELEHLARLGRPFALRVHSFDFDIADIARVAKHPCCVGIWAFPFHAKMLPGAHALAPIFMTHAEMPDPQAERKCIASISAGLPKKDWPLLLDAMNRLPEFDRLIVMARTNGFEDLPDDVTRLAAELPNPVAVQVNLPRRDVFGLLSRTAAMLYTVSPGVALGMPMSVIEALRAGACVITPDAPEMRELCGPGFRPYRDAADIVTQVRDIMAGGENIARERAANREWATLQYCDPARARIFHDELSAALVAWRELRQAV
jgi:glycosyltransferase involved in cell wall biosynthesis